MKSAILLIHLLFSIASGIPYKSVDELYGTDIYDDDTGTDSEEYESEIFRIPKFISDPLSMLVNEGETVRLPCVVDKLQGFVLMWKYQDDILTIANQTVKPRFRTEALQDGNNLIIDQITPEEEGEYECTISAPVPKVLRHKIQVRVKPVIETKPGEVLVVREGEPASLSCQVLKGSPSPSISWVRKHKNQVIPNNIVRWDAVSRHDGGHYICQADNGFGPNPVSKEVRLEVHHVPHVEIGEELIHTTEGEEAKLMCTVHCSPRCEVVWTKDGQPIDSSDNNLYLTTIAAVRSLTILKISREYFGEYSCTAKNQMGSSSAAVKVSGLAHTAVFQDNTLSPWLDKFFLEWSSVSKSPVETFTVEYRAEREFKWRKREVKAISKDTNEWQGSITLDGLSPATRYEARVSARNQYGYNDYTKPFHFATKGAEPRQSPSISGSATTLVNSSLLLCALIYILG